MEKYLTYLIEDFAAEESFQQWAFKENQKAEDFWGVFVEKYPEKRAEIDEAVALLKALEPNKKAEKYAAETQAAIALFQATIKSEKKPILSVSKDTKTHYFYPNFRRVAASLLILIAFGVLAYFIVNNYFLTITHETAYGETQKIILPDGSKITLNSNSTLRFAKNWAKGENREVWLEGEAFFEVQKQANLEKQGLVKFVVHSANVAVEVLGTQFDVWNRKNKVAVVLNEGRIQLKIQDNNKQIQTVDMLPNERVEVAENQKTFTKTKIKTQLYTSWKSQEFVFESMPLSEIAKKIEEVYGLKVKFEDKNMQKETLTGVIPCKNEQLFFDVLAAALGIKITKEKEKQEVTFSRKN